MSNSNTQYPKAIRQKATYSLILGIISAILPYIIWVWQGTGLRFGSAWVFLLGMLVAVICAILGLRFGIKGLKSTRRKLAIAGIAVCTISLLWWMYFFGVWLMGGGPSNL